MMMQGFWKQLKRPVMAMSPMDGVTDAAFRVITAKYGKPDVAITEFTSVEGIEAGATQALRAFYYDECERPVVAQVFGSKPEAFYKTAFVVAELGFDGIDINMGCPAKNIASKGGGAGLILTPELAKKIVRETQRGLKEWSAGKNITDIGLPETILEYVQSVKRENLQRRELPVSVKTRLGYDKIVIEEWVRHLLEVEPVNISIHGRTLKQMYGGSADWEAIARAAAIIHQTETTVLGNGDVKNLAEAHEKVQRYGVDGVLIGRAAFGNPWIFQNKEAPVSERFSVAIEHAQLYEKIFGDRLFMPMRKHLAWYCRGFPNAADVRQKLMQTKNSREVAEILGT